MKTEKTMQKKEKKKKKMKTKKKKMKQALKRYMASGSHCPIGFHLVIGCCDEAAATTVANDLWHHTGQSLVSVSMFL